MVTGELTSLGHNPSGCHTAIKPLLALELVIKRESGKNQYLKVNNKDHQLVPFNTFMNLNNVRMTIFPIKDDIITAILFDSCSRRDDSYRSDNDLFIVAEDKLKVNKVLRGREIEGRHLNALVVSPLEVMTMRDSDRSSMDEVDEGLMIWSKDNGWVR